MLQCDLFRVLCPSTVSKQSNVLEVRDLGLICKQSVTYFHMPTENFTALIGIVLADIVQLLEIISLLMVLDEPCFWQELQENLCKHFRTRKYKVM